MNKAANTYWADARIAAQRPAPRALPSPFGGLTGVRTASRRRAVISPMWVFSMVILAMFTLCVTVTLRTQTKMHRAAAHHKTINSEVESLRSTNANLAREVERLRSDPRAIEAAARSRLGMVRANEIIVTVD